jgi:hypothetical protein
MRLFRMVHAQGSLTPSKVSTNASSIKKVLVKNAMIMELSLRTSKIVVNRARGPLKTDNTAA